MNANILIVEDDADVRESLKILLQREGYVVAAVETGSGAIRLLERAPQNLVLLDLGLPDIKGEALCYEIKRNYPQTMVIMITARGTANDLVKGLSLGADDYIAKPFDTEVVIARIHAVLRRTRGEDGVLTCGDLRLDPHTTQVTRNDKKIELTHTEYKLLHYLMLNRERMLSRELILNHVWAYDFEVESRVVDVYIGYLRKKIDSGHPKKYIESRRGFGYRLTCGT